MDTGQTSENSRSPLPLPAPELYRLNVFVGNWRSEGNSYGNNHQSKNNPYASAQKWVSDESYEWVSENFFLIHRWNGYVGGNNFKGLEIMGYDVARKEYFTRKFDEEGNATKYKVTVTDDTWKFIEPFTRTTIVFGNKGNTMTFQREWRQEGGDWLPLCNRKASKK